MVPLIHCLTRGHAWTVNLLLQAMEQRRRDSPVSVGLRHVLDLPVSPDAAAGEGGIATTVAHRALHHLLQEVRPGLLERLITWSAAHAISQMIRMDGEDLPDAAARQGFTDAIAGWTEAAGVGQVLHPLLRRLLLHELGARPAGHARGWDAVNDRLRQDYEDRLREPLADPGELEELRDRAQYHQLAAGRLRPVVQPC
jgi:hypothetical protein